MGSITVALPIAIQLMTYIVVLLGLFQVLYRASRVAVSPLRSIPGPFWARLTNLWYFNRVRRGSFEKDNIQLHQKYGPVVRVSPNHYSICDPAAVKIIYGSGSKFRKSAWYEAWSIPKQWTIFSDRDIKHHAESRKRFTNLYSMTSLVHYEPLVDKCLEVFSQRMDELSQGKDTFNLAHWLQCYAFDVISQITFGDRFGFLDRGDDIYGAIDSVDKLTIYSTLMGIYPDWHSRLFGFMSKFKSSGAGGRAFVAQFVRDKIRSVENGLLEAESAKDDNTRAFMSRMIEERDKSPEKVTDYHLFIMGQSNVNAGADTTATSLSGIMWYLANNPGTLQKLRKELDELIPRERGSSSITFKETQNMPYFQAVMKEALRMHAATGLPLWREVPAEGAKISGRFFPAGTIVGINAWTAHYHESTFPDACAFRPERWLEGETDPEQLKVMNNMYMPFGLGSRTCLGKHISILEMSKMIPRLVRDYDIYPVRPTVATENYWFVKFKDFEVRVERRAPW